MTAQAARTPLIPGAAGSAVNGAASTLRLRVRSESAGPDAGGSAGFVLVLSWRLEPAVTFERGFPKTICIASESPLHSFGGSRGSSLSPRIPSRT